MAGKARSSTGQNVIFASYKNRDGVTVYEGMVHAPGGRGLVLCQPNLVGANVRRTAERVTCLECIVLEE